MRLELLQVTLYLAIIPPFSGSASNAAAGVEFRAVSAIFGVAGATTGTISNLATDGVTLHADDTFPDLDPAPKNKNKI